MIKLTSTDQIIGVHDKQKMNFDRYDIEVGTPFSTKEYSIVVDFINETDLDILQDKPNVIDSFFAYAQSKQKTEASELIAEENLNEEEAKRYIIASLKREYASENGTELNAILPKMSPLNPQYLTKKQSVFQKIAAFIEKFKGVGGQI